MQSKNENLKMSKSVLELGLDNVDGLLTNQKGIALCTTSADCISLLFYDPEVFILDGKAPCKELVKKQ